MTACASADLNFEDGWPRVQVECAHPHNPIYAVRLLNILIRRKWTLLKRKYVLIVKYYLHISDVIGRNIFPVLRRQKCDFLGVYKHAEKVTFLHLLCAPLTSCTQYCYFAVLGLLQTSVKVFATETWKFASVCKLPRTAKYLIRGTQHCYYFIL